MAVVWVGTAGVIVVDDMVGGLSLGLWVSRSKQAENKKQSSL